MSSLFRAVADIIKNFSVATKNYSAAHIELIRLYENKVLTIQARVRASLNTPKVSVATADKLRKLHHRVASRIRTLKALGQLVQH